MTYNIEGGRETDTVIKIVGAEKKISVVAVQEAGPDRRINDLRNAMSALRLNYDQVARAPAYDLHVATFTRDPITRADRLPGFRNAGLITTIHNPDLGLIAICNAHLTPFTEDERLREMETALSQLSKSGAHHRIIAGDLNSLSSQDNYPSALLDSFNDAQRKKFMAGGIVQHRVLTLPIRAFSEHSCVFPADSP
jgi:endonuclease/exonuclease/phosphatase family metal-dependent hydrolase